MPDIALLAAAIALPLAATLGLLAHECTHALALRLAGIEYTVEFFPHRGGVLGTLATCPWARVRPHPTGREPPWTLRVAALMPLTLLVPLVVLARHGAPLAGDHVVLTAAAIGWAACAIPSPQDFSVAWYAHRALERVESTDECVAVRADGGH